MWRESPYLGTLSGCQRDDLLVFLEALEACGDLSELASHEDLIDELTDRFRGRP